ncbi:hypothetical protein A2U01_0041744, partial [Trifolium medium]|nr:hypothetical protein [Trifolium medium]
MFTDPQKTTNFRSSKEVYSGRANRIQTHLTGVRKGIVRCFGYGIGGNPQGFNVPTDAANKAL